MFVSPSPGLLGGWCAAAGWGVRDHPLHPLNHGRQLLHCLSGCVREGREGERERGRERGGEGGREGGRERGREGEREGGKESRSRKDRG